MIFFRIVKKFNIILSKHQKIRVIELFAMMVIGGFMEMLSVSLIIPFVQAIMNPEAIMSNSYAKRIMVFFRLESFQAFILVLTLSMATLYFIKNAFLVFQVTIQEKFVQNNQFAFQKNMLHAFLSKPYEYYLSANSGEIMRIVLTDTTAAFSTLTTILSFLSEMVVAVILSITVLIISPLITIVMTAILMLTVLIIYLLSHNIIKNAGKRYQVVMGEMFSILVQALNGIKEVKLMRKEKFFENKFETDGRELIQSAYINKMATILPRNMIEAMAMCSFFILLAFMIFKGTELEVLIPTISAIAMASVRLLPCVNRVSTSFSQLTYSEPSVDRLLENIEYLNDISDANDHNHHKFENKIISFDRDIIAQNIYYKYPTAANSIFENVMLEIKKGQSVGIIGTSGTGKTTLVDIMLGLLQPYKGRILVDGIDIFTDMEGWLKKVGYIPQSIFLLDGTIRENVAFGVDEDDIDDNKVMKALKEASLEKYIDDLPDGIDTQVGERGIRLSGGQKQRIGIARALYNNPEILFFDEATSALDNETEEAIMDSINSLKGLKTMIIIAHRLSTIEKCDIVYRVEAGNIIRER